MYKRSQPFAKSCILSRGNSARLEANNKYYNIILSREIHTNISDAEVPVRVVAKTCTCKSDNKRKVTYAFVDSYHSLCLDKKDIIYAELEACEKLLNYAADQVDRKTIGSEISELKMALDLLT